MNPFSSAEMAEGYARSRPPVHPRIIERIGLERVSCALDLGCGAGISTRALEDVADTCIGIDPAEPMMRWARLTAPFAQFAVGMAEAIPLADQSVDLITAAGSLNYADLDRFFGEAARVLRSSGALAVYDFSPGRVVDEWFYEFECRYPWPRNEARVLNPETLVREASGFQLHSKEEFAIALPLTRRFCVDYVLTETNVADAVRGGVPLESIRSWCEATLHDFWPDDSAVREVLFRGYWVCLTRQGSPVISRRGILAS